MKTAFHYILNERHSIQKIITVDADGQHRTKDVCALYQASFEQDGILLGVRNFDRKDIPFKVALEINSLETYSAIQLASE